jgi:hypothetical protein
MSLDYGLSRRAIATVLALSSWAGWVINAPTFDYSPEDREAAAQKLREFEAILKERLTTAMASRIDDAPAAALAAGILQAEGMILRLREGFLP